MKISKKIALLVMIFILSATFNTYAADYATTKTGVPEITLTANATEVKVGDEVTITISAKCDTGVGEFNSVLIWNNTKLKLKSIEEHEYYSSLSGNDGEKQYITIFYGDELGNAPEENPTEVDELVKLKFEVLDEAVVGEELDVKLSEIEFTDGDEGYTNPDDEEIILTVVTAAQDDEANDGENGEADDDADDGENGEEGDDGDDGGNGEEGDDGDDGENGEEGDDGDDGENSEEGDDGDDGENSEEGDDGDDGENGEEGDDGNDGDDGEEGDDGNDGDDGEKGDDGDEGDDGKNSGIGSGDDDSAGNTETKDTTTADKPINNAGLEVYGLIGLAAIIVVVVVLYIKCKQYSDVK